MAPCLLVLFFFIPPLLLVLPLVLSTPTATLIAYTYLVHDVNLGHPLLFGAYAHHCMEIKLDVAASPIAAMVSKQ